ncbi:MAG: DUF2993 domain-containing protein [Gomphosphaeria aponina SAG 52.96 = DSM 107014]|uniref:DUF2993 domain-containing protein n=1 Tax=Gomphosphaeria aponina SAG 52.96 = DSM 107014 TaxID=1521640 RepID=A0A941GP31_9CHRO|nr:DUF2993 domain-containing protein [Gomphosphaeria aponina SAG 52.96 = DSM 107014]
MDGLGEKTLNKIAELALSSQLKQSEKLTVEVKTDPNLLAKGMLESLAINGTGLVMQKNQRLQEMQIILKSIAVNPLKALMGNIQLRRPSQGTACIVLNEADIESAIAVETLRKQIRNYKIYLDGQKVTVDIEKVNFRLLADGKVDIKARFRIWETGQMREVCLTITPRVCATGRGVIIEDVKCSKGEELSPLLTNALIEEAKKILNLSSFQMDGISLLINKLVIQEGKLTLQAAAGITRFPTV